MSYAAKESALTLRIAEAGITYFSAREALTLGSSHYASRSTAYALNRLPPDDFLRNIIPALKALDDARAVLGCPVLINSAYRSRPYNNALGGAPASKHLTFHAIDAHPADPDLLDNLYRLLAESRRRHQWAGGLGGYRSFVHLDCGSDHDRTWGITY